MTELQLMAKVATHPLVSQYRRAIQILHRRFSTIYGPDYACPEVGRMSESQRGHNRMTEADENLFNSLMRGAANIRRDVRNSLIGD